MPVILSGGLGFARESKSVVEGPHIPVRYPECQRAFPARVPAEDSRRSKSILALIASTFFKAQLLLLVLALPACKPKPAQEQYPFHGMIITIEPRGHSALIQHEDVPGLMKGMTMPFTVKDDKVLAALKPGDVIQATLIKQDYESWLDDIKILSHNDLGDDKPAIATPLQLPKAGVVVPDFPFIDQDGKSGHFTQFRGAPVLLTFIYTRCPLPDFCPRMNANLLTIAQKANTPSLRLLSISFDPEHDTPAVLRSYSRRWIDELPPAQRSHWQFIVPDKKDLPQLFKFFALTAEPDEGFITHSLSTALIDSDGKLAGWYEGNQWTTEEVLKDIAVITTPEPGSASPSAKTSRRAH